MVKKKENIDDFNFDLNEVEGLVKVKAKEALALFKKGSGNITVKVIKNENGKNITYDKIVTIKDFLVYSHETALSKYGEVLKKVIELTE